MEKLTFGFGNAKLGAGIATFSLPCGVTCPGAKDCKSWVGVIDGKRKLFGCGKFTCYSASLELVRKAVFEARHRNLRLLKVAKTVKKASELISASLPDSSIKVIRPGVAGDFYNQTYFDAWLSIAKEYPSRTFYAYTKSLPFWVKRLSEIPPNFVLTASLGGKYDDLAKRHSLNTVEVVFTPEKAQAKGLELDHDDSHAIKGDKPFALLLHGLQLKGPNSIALAKLRKRGIRGYSANLF